MFFPALYLAALISPFTFFSGKSELPPTAGSPVGDRLAICGLPAGIDVRTLPLVGTLTVVRVCGFRAPWHD